MLWSGYTLLFWGFCQIKGYDISIKDIVVPGSWDGKWPPPLYDDSKSGPEPGVKPGDHPGDMPWTYPSPDKPASDGKGNGKGGGKSNGGGTSSGGGGVIWA